MERFLEQKNGDIQDLNQRESRLQSELETLQQVPNFTVKIHPKIIPKLSFDMKSVKCKVMLDMSNRLLRYVQGWVSPQYSCNIGDSLELMLALEDHSIKE